MILKLNVEGYTISGYDASSVYGGESPASNQFWILLKEGAYPDTGVTPKWRHS